MHTLCLENIYLDDDFFLLLETLNQEKPLKVVGRIRPSECSPLQVVKQFIAHNYERWFQVFGEYDPDDSGFISQLQFREGLKVSGVIDMTNRSPKKLINNRKKKCQLIFIFD